MVSRLSMALVRVRAGNGKLEQSLKFTMLSSQRWRPHGAKQRKKRPFSHYFKAIFLIVGDVKHVKVVRVGSNGMI